MWAQYRPLGYSLKGLQIRLETELKLDYFKALRKVT